MPTYQVEMGGKSFEVDAPSIDAFMEAYHGQPAAPSHEGEGFFEHAGHRIASWPGRIAETLKSAVTLPRDVMKGEAPVFSQDASGNRVFDPETFNRAKDLAILAVPGSPAAGTGRSIAVRAGRGSGNMEAARVAADLGAPLPAGLASDNALTQAATGMAGQLPLVGAKISERAGKTVEAAGKRVGEIADTLGGGAAPDRATLGANLRPSIKGAIDTNNGRIDDVFKTVRGTIDPDKVAELPRTRAVLGNIMADRMAAGASNPLAGLDDIANLVRSGASFNGLQRARSDIGNSLNFGTANPGFNAGDLKKLYGAMSADMHNVVEKTAVPGTPPGAASAALKAANGEASKLIEGNKNLQKLLGVQSDEGMAGSVIRAAQEKGGNVRLLAQLRQQLPKQDFEQIAGAGLAELGHQASTNQFSLAKFGTEWGKLSEGAKAVLFDPGHRKALDDIATLAGHFKSADKYRNTSNTGGAVGLQALIGGAGASIIHALSGDPLKLGGTVLAGFGGWGLAKFLARPAGASTLARWARAIDRAYKQPNAAHRASLVVATKNLLQNRNEP